MIKGKKILIVGAGGFIGGHLTNRLLNDGNTIVAADIKPKEYWFQDFDNVENHYSMDMKDINNCRLVTKKWTLYSIWHVIWVEWVLLKIIKPNVCNQY